MHRATMLAVEARRVEPRGTFPVSGASTGVEKTCGERAKVMRGRTFGSKLRAPVLPAMRRFASPVPRVPTMRRPNFEAPSTVTAIPQRSPQRRLVLAWRASVKPFLKSLHRTCQKGTRTKTASLLKSRSVPARDIAVARRADPQRRQPWDRRARRSPGALERHTTTVWLSASTEAQWDPRSEAERSRPMAGGRQQRPSFGDCSSAASHCTAARATGSARSASASRAASAPSRHG